MPSVVLWCQAVVAATFAWSAVTKLAGRAAFAEFCRWLVVAVRVPPRTARPAAVAAVTAEAGTAVAMLLPAAAPAGFVSATLLLAVFTAAVAGMWHRRVVVPCRCFGAGRHPPGPAQLIRNATLLLVAVAGGVLSWTGTTAAPLDRGGALAAVAGVTAALLVIELEDIVAVVRPRRPARTTGG